MTSEGEALVDFKICGSVHVRIGETWSADWYGSRKTAGMLGVLLTRPRQTIPASGLVEWLWGSDTDQSPQRLYDYVSKLRKVLVRMESPPAIHAAHGGYRIDVDATRVDLHRATELRDQGHDAATAGDHERACALLEEALCSVPEPPLLDLQTPLAEEYRNRVVRRVILPCHYTLMASWLVLGNPERVLDALDEIQPDHELNLTLAKRRLAALRGTSRHDEANEYTIEMRRALTTQGLFDEADELLAYADTLRPTAIPAPRTPPDRTANDDVAITLLPSGHDQLTGRDDLLAELDARTDQARAAKVIVLTGTAGVGKTALALHWARQVRRQFTKGCIYLDLQGFSTAAPMTATDLVRRLLQLFGTSPDLLGGEQAQLDRLAALLGQRRILLVLDNVADHRQVQPVLDSAPEALILLASRHHLGPIMLRYGATEIRVPVLPPDTVRTWMQTTLGARCEREPEVLAELIELTSGVPLAINIISYYAADRPAGTLRDIASLLREESRVLDIGCTNPAATSISASFRLSYRELDPSAQRLFRLLGSHPTSAVALGAVIALAGTSRREALASLDALVDASLVEHAGTEVRFHDLLHDYAGQCANDGQHRDERAAGIDRLLTYYLASASSAERILFPQRPSVPTGLDGSSVASMVFDSEHEAFQWHSDQRQALIAAVRLAHENDDHNRVWRLANIINEPLKRQGHYREALTCLQLARASIQAIPAAERRSDPDLGGEPGTLNNLGYIYIELREYQAARQHFAEAHALFLEANNPFGIAIALHNLGYERFLVDDLDAAEQLFQRAITVQQEHDLDHARAGTLRRLASVHQRRGDHHVAKVLWDRALTIFEAAGNSQGAGAVLHDCAQAHLDADEAIRAVDYGEHALTCSQRAHDLVTFADSCRVLAEAHLKQHHYDRAVEYSRDSIRACEGFSAPRTEARVLDILATALHRIGSHEEAEKGWLRSLRLYRELDDPQWTAVRERLDQM